MTELRLKAGVNFAPSGHVFSDPKSGFQVDMYQRGIEGGVQMLIGHRQANPKLFPPTEYVHFSPTAVKQELLQHLYKTAPQLFKGEPVPTVARTASGFPEKCVCGATEFDQTECPTCSGHRINGYRCKKCGKSYGL